MATISSDDRYAGVVTTAKADAALGFLGRGELFSVVFAVAFANAIFGIAAQEVEANGLTAALVNTFGISAILWAALYFAIRLALSDPQRAIRPYEWLLAVGALTAAALPIPQFASLALFGTAAILVLTSQSRSPMQRAAWIMMASTIPIFWGRRVMAYFGDLLLGFDAHLVSAILGTGRNGNLVGIPGQTGYLQVLEECSSFANISLSILCWTVFTQVYDRRWRPSNLGWVAAAAGAVLVINTTRMALIGFFPSYYDVLHGPTGATVANYLIIAAVVAICAVGVRFDRAK